jgi:tetratricopeptide (TPR) repeat protein
VAESLSLFLAATGRWDEAERTLDEAAAIMEGLGDRRRYEECLLLQAIVFLERGQVDRAMRAYSQCATTARERGDTHVLGGALSSQGFLLARENRLDEAQPLLEEALELLRQSRALPETIGVKASLGLVAHRRGDRDVALRWAGDALEIMRKTMPTAVYAVEAYSDVAEIFLATWEADPARADRGIRRNAASSVKQIGRAATTFPMFRPRALYWEGVQAALLGRTARARACWTQAQREAERLSEPLDVSRSQARLAGPGPLNP